MPDEQEIAINRLKDNYYDSNLPTSCYFIVGARLKKSENPATGNVRIDDQKIVNTVAGFEEVDQGLPCMTSRLTVTTEAREDFCSAVISLRNGD
jgi:hypothetical protein